MPHVMTVSALAVLSAVGAVVGTHLGRDAVAQINPIFFSELPQTRFLVDDTPTPYRLGTADPVRADSSWSNVFNAGGRPACLDCPPNFVDPLHAGAEPAARVPRQKSEWDSPVAFERPMSSRELDRYSSFPVTEQEAQEPAAVPDAYADSSSPQAESGDEQAQPVGM